MRDNVTNEVVQYGGLSGEVLQNLLQDITFVNFSRVEYVSDTAYGDVAVHNVTQSTGLVGRLVRGEVDILAVLLVLTRTRAHLAHYLRPLNYAGQIIVMHVNAMRSEDFDAFGGLAFAPFAPMTWLCLLGAVLMFPVVMMFISRLVDVSQGSFAVGERTPGGRTCRAYRSCLDYCVRVTLGQDTAAGGWSAPINVLRMALYLFVVAVTALYTGSFTALLAVPGQLRLPVHSYADLLQAYPDITPLVLYPSHWITRLTKGNADERKLADRIIADRKTHINSIEEGVHIVQRSKTHALLTGQPTFYSYAYRALKRRGRCEIVGTAEPLFAHYYESFMVSRQQRKVNITELIQGVEYFKAMGLLVHWYKQHIDASEKGKACLERNVNTNKHQHANIGISVNDLQSLFLLYICCIALSCLVFLVEHVYSTLCACRVAADDITGRAYYGVGELWGANELTVRVEGNLVDTIT